MFALIIIGVIFLVMSFTMMKKAKTVYQTTGVNTVSGIHKVLWYVEIIPLFLAFSLFTDDKTALGILTLIGTVLAFSALHFLLSRKAGKNNAIVMGVLQGVAGGILALLNVFVLVANIALKTNISMFDIDMAAAAQIDKDTDAQIELSRQAREHAEAERLERAEACAQRNGFRDAEEAERAGLDTGKYRA